MPGGPCVVETTQVYTRVTITNLKDVHRRSRLHEQHHGGDAHEGDQSDTFCTENLTLESETGLRWRASPAV
jgi:hypothetical protein